MDACLVVKVIDNDNDLIGAYATHIEIPNILPFNMRIVRNNDLIWNTRHGEENPRIKDIVYNIDEEKVFYLFEVHDFLTSSFWTKIEKINSSYELSQFD